MIHLQDSILKCLDDHTFFNMISDGILEAHYAQILSCFDLGANAWLIAWLIFWTFWLFSSIFFTMLWMWLRLPHLSIASLPDVCAHIPLTLWVSTFYVVLIATSAQVPMMQFMTLLPPLREMLASTWDNNYMHFLQSHSILLVNESTLCSPKMKFAL